MKCIVIPANHQSKLPIEWRNIRLEGLLNIDSDLCLTKDSFDWQELRDKIAASNNQNLKDKWDQLKTWVQNQIDSGKLIDFIPLPYTEP